MNSSRGMEIMNTYMRYMIGTFPQDPNAQWLRCLDFSTQMQEKFPELILCKGYVYSKINEDNYSKKYPKQYPHAWLKTTDDVILDPTVLQFINIGELVYVETPHVIYKCFGCGQYQEKDEYYCGKCEYSE